MEEWRLIVVVAITVLAVAVTAVAVVRGERIAERAPGPMRPSRGQSVYGRVGLVGLALAIVITALTGSSWAFPVAFVVAVAAGAFAARRKDE